MRRRNGLSGPESGQGTIEYILVLVIVIIIILSLLFQFNSSFKAFAEALFGNYLTCLLETGELPGTGSTCKDQFAAFDASKGKQYLKDNLPEGSGGSSGGGGGGNKKGAEKKQATEEKKRTGGGGGGEAMGGGGGGRSVVGSFGDTGRRASADVGKIDAGGETGLKSDSLIGASNTVVVGRSGETYRNESVQMSFRMENDEDRAEARASSVAAGTTVDTDTLRNSKGVENLNRGLEGPAQEKDRSFSIGEFVRFVLIILIVVAMVIFFGGQLMQISRSREKGGD